MTALLLQTLLLMIPAFFIGAALACGLRRLLTPSVEARRATVAAPSMAAETVTPPIARKTADVPAASVATPAQPQPAATKTVTTTPPSAQPRGETSPTPVATNRFDDTLRPRAPEAPRPAPTPAPTAPVAAPTQPVVARPAPPPPPAPAPAPMPSTATAAPTSAPVSPRVVAEEPKRIAVPATSEMIAGAAAAAAAAAAAVATQARSTVTPAPQQSPALQQSSASPAAPVLQPVEALPTPAPAASVSQPIVAAMPKPVERPNVTAAPAVAAPVGAQQTSADDLTRIGVIDSTLAGELKKRGITRFNQIASWQTADVKSVSEAFGFKGRIEQENWIEQAQILASGSETYYSKNRGTTAAAVPMSPVSSAQIPKPAPASAAPVLEPRVSERSAFASDPAAQRPSTVSTSAETKSAPVTAAAVTAPASATAAPLAAATLAAAAAALANRASDAVAAKPQTPLASDLPVATSVRPSVPPQRDNLQRIGGINAEIEKLLGGQNIVRYGQIAGWSGDDIGRFDRLLGSQGRIARENWVEQAQILSKGGNTAFSRDFDRRASDADRKPLTRPGDLIKASIEAPVVAVPTATAETTRPIESALHPRSIADAIKANPNAPAGKVADVTGLRSVRSEAYRPPAVDAATAAAAAAAASTGSARVVRSAEVDDLKRIRGIGVLIEKRLNAEGVVGYGQIAEWTNDDIDRISSKLDFKGRIERENWVEQARILASGGQTEFSRRVDRGEVETSKPR